MNSLPGSVIIERYSDIPIFKSIYDSCEGVNVLTPNVSVYLRLKGEGVDVKKLGRTKEYMGDLEKMEEGNKLKVLKIKQDIAKYLNEKEDYKYRSCHHPDHFIQYYKRLLFAIEYRYVILSRVLNLDDVENRKHSVGILSGDRGPEEFFNDNAEGWPKDLFQRHDRSFSKVLEWADPGIVKIIDDVSSKVKAEEFVCNEYLMSGNCVFRLKRSISQLYYDISFRAKHLGGSIVLHDISYAHSDYPDVQDGTEVYKLRKHVLMASFNKFKRDNAHVTQQVNNIVDLVFEDVIENNDDYRIFEINGFNYYPYIRETLRTYLFDEIASFFWADSYIDKHFRGYIIDSIYSDVPHYPPIYAIHRLLSKIRGVKSYGYPHGAEGYYDYFWQERFTAAGVDYRIVGSEDQKKHFERQQENHYLEKYHSKFIVKQLRYCSGGVNRVRKEYDIVYVMDIARSNQLYTIVNYPDAFEFYTAQEYIINNLVEICNRKNKRLCIKAKYGTDRELLKYLFCKVPENVSMVVDGELYDLLCISEKVVIECPGTVLFQSLECGKRVMCINCYNTISEDLHNYMKNMQVVYVEYDNNMLDYVKSMLDNFICK